jgi:hypothetical protein
MLILLGCLGKVGWDFYQTRLINEAMVPYAIALVIAFFVLNRQKRNRRKSSLVAPGVRQLPILMLVPFKPGTTVF